MSPLAPGQARGLSRAALLLGLFFVAATGCGGVNPHELARADDRLDRTGIYTWLVEHEPSALIAWRVPVARLRTLVPNARIEAGHEPDPCAQAVRSHAALVLIARPLSARLRERALDCGVALYRDDGGLVVAPR